MFGSSAVWKLPVTDRVWFYPPWTLTRPVWGPPVWTGADEHGRRTVVLQPPLIGALVIAVGS